MRAAIVHGILQGLAGARSLSGGWIGDWSPGIGDPTFIGWFTVVAYFLSAYLCLRAFKAQKRTPDAVGGVRAYWEAAVSCLRAFRGFRRRLGEVPAKARLAMLWLLLSLALFLLGINKQLDLQSLFTELGKIAAFKGGWYEERRSVQSAFIVVLVGGGIGTVFVFQRLVRGQFRQARWALLGMLFLVGFVLIRAASFHHVDIILSSSFAGVRMNWLFELGGIAIIGAAAAQQSDLRATVERVRREVRSLVAFARDAARK